MGIYLLNIRSSINCTYGTIKESSIKYMYGTIKETFLLPLHGKKKIAPSKLCGCFVDVALLHQWPVINFKITIPQTHFIPNIAGKYPSSRQ